MPKITFKKPQIRSIVTTVGDKVVSIESESEMMGLDEFTVNRLKKTIGLGTRRVVSNGVCTSDLCVQSAEKIFEQGIINKQEIESVLLVTQTGDYKAPSTAIIIQDRLGLPVTTLAFDINLGCSGFVIGLLNAFSLVESGLKNCLLLVGDISSNFSGKNDRTFTPLMGDAGSAILIDNTSKSTSYFVTGSDGSGFDSLIIPSGIDFELENINDFLTVDTGNVYWLIFSLKHRASIFDRGLYSEFSFGRSIASTKKITSVKFGDTLAAYKLQAQIKQYIINRIWLELKLDHLIYQTEMSGTQSIVGINLGVTL